MALSNPTSPPFGGFLASFQWQAAEPSGVGFQLEGFGEAFFLVGFIRRYIRLCLLHGAP